MIIDIVRFDSPRNHQRHPACSLMTVFRWAPQIKKSYSKITNKWIYEQEARKQIAVVTGGNAGIGFRVPLL